MRARLLLACACAVIAATTAPVFAVPPQADVVVGESGPCLMAAVTDSAASDIRTGVLASQPVLAAGNIRCSIQVGSESHGGFDAAENGRGGAGPTLLPPKVVSYVSPDDVPVYLCAEFTPMGQNAAAYWDAGEDAWSSEESVPCDLVLQVGRDDAPVPFHEINNEVCPWLAVLLPPDGDIGEAYDCPPYYG